MAESSDPLRAQLIRSLDWEQAHVGYDVAVNGIAPDKRGIVPAGFQYSCWQLVEHLRLAQKDLLDFCTSARYVHALKWPDDYWPRAAPPAGSAWDESVADFKADRDKLKQFIRTTTADLYALVPTGQGDQTYIRTILLVVDHNAYHVGQLVVVRRALGIWK